MVAFLTIPPPTKELDRNGEKKCQFTQVLVSQWLMTKILSFPSSLVPKLPLGNAPLGSSASRAEVIMTRSRYRIFETEYPYFMTCTIVGGSIPKKWCVFPGF